MRSWKWGVKGVGGGLAVKVGVVGRERRLWGLEAGVGCFQR